MSLNGMNKTRDNNHPIGRTAFFSGDNNLPPHFIRRAEPGSHPTPSPLNLSSNANDFLNDDMQGIDIDFKDAKQLPPLPAEAHQATFHSSFRQPANSPAISNNTFSMNNDNYHLTDPQSSANLNMYSLQPHLQPHLQTHSQIHLPNVNASICTICNFFIDEDLLELSCNHLCHRDCFINNILTCKKCNDLNLSNESLISNFNSAENTFGKTSAPAATGANNIGNPNPSEFVTPVFGPVDVPMTPSDKIIPDPLRNAPINVSVTEPTNQSQPQGAVQNQLQPPAPTETTSLKQHVVNESYNNRSHAFNPVVPNHIQQANLQHQQQQLLSPRSSFNKNLNKDLFDSLMKPKIKFISEDQDSEKISVNPNNEDEVLKLNYLINIKPPKFFNSINDEKDLAVKNQILDEIKFNILNNIINWNGDGIIDFNNLGKLIIFEIIDISTNGSSWDQIRLFLFENSLLLIDLKGENLIGQIFINKDISDMTRFISGLRLNLNNEAIPELQICSDIPLIISRLEYYFKKLLDNQFIQETSLFQLTTNGWNLIKENYYSNLPIDILRFQNCIENNLEIPEDLLIKSMPSPEIVPLNLIIAITLLNNNSSQVSNSEYRCRIIDFLDSVRRNLRPFDRLSLIFIGIDGAGFPCKKGSFIGSVEPNWSGWDSIYNEVKIQSNVNHKGHPILHNGYDELQIALSKCKDLFPFLNTSLKNSNKLVIINSNTYDSKNYYNAKNMSDKISYIENQFKTLLNNNEKNLSIDFFRIGKNYPPELEFGQRFCSQPSLLLNDVLKIPYDSKLLRFDDFGSFTNDFVKILTTYYHQICLPNISLDILKIIGTRDMVKFFKIEVNGRLIEINNFSNLKLVLNNVMVNSEKNLMLNLQLNLHKLKLDNVNDNHEKIIEIPLLSYMTSWLNESDDYKVLNTRIHQDRPANNFSNYLGGNLTPPLNQDYEADNYFDARTNSSQQPLQTPKNKKFIKKDIELEVIKTLRAINTNQAINNKHIIRDLSNYLITAKNSILADAATRTVDYRKNDIISFKHSEFTINKLPCYDLSTFIDSLLNQMMFLSQAVDSNDPQALMACKDLTNWLV